MRGPREWWQAGVVSRGALRSIQPGMRYDPHAEWLEADGLGGFASGTASGIRTRRYHALLLAATTPPTGRMALVNGMEAWIETRDGRFALSSHRYHPEVVHPDGASRIESFTTDPWPTWVLVLPDGTRVEQQLFVPRDRPACVLSWKMAGERPARLELRPLISGRDYHATHHENGAFRFEGAELGPGRVRWQPYDGIPAIEAHTNGHFDPHPDWYRRFSYDEERRRGLDHLEDLASPGVFSWRLEDAEAHCIFATATHGLDLSGAVGDTVRALRRRELRRRSAFPSRLHRSADAYIVRRGRGRTIVAGYPWFTDWGRDTFVALRGLCLSTGRLADAHRILVQWADAVSEGMLPNRFPDGGEVPEFNAVDASLWYVLAVQEFLARAAAREFRLPRRDRQALDGAVEAILSGYARGTRFGIAADDDGLLKCGVPGAQLTWMDARVGDRVITPRIGKPVEVQALWLNALHAASASHPWCGAIYESGRATFERRFWNDRDGCLFDVVDCDHVTGTADGSVRPNQIFALGGLPITLVDGRRARQALDVVESRLLTPLGLRSLDPRDPAYVPVYAGGPAERDAAYHQGTVWPWLLTAFVDAWLRVRGNSDAARVEARERFLDPLLTHLEEAGIGHVSEIADADPPFTPRGCPFQAWSVGELLRLQLDVLGVRPFTRTHLES